MTMLMIGFMIILEVVLMGHSFGAQYIPILLVVVGLVISLVSFIFIRKQTFIGDKEFLKSMIVHHDGGILQAKEILKKTKNDKIKTLATGIAQLQSAEIDIMRNLLNNM